MARPAGDAPGHGVAGLAEVFEKIRDSKEPISSEDVSRLVSEYGDKPHDTEDEDLEMKIVGRHFYSTRF